MCFIVATKRPAQAFAVSYLIVYSFILPFIFVVCRLFAPCLIGAGRSGFLSYNVPQNIFFTLFAQGVEVDKLCTFANFVGCCLQNLRICR